MALIKTVYVKNQIEVLNAYHKVTRIEVVIEGTNAPNVSCVVEVFKDKATSEKVGQPGENVEPLERIGIALSSLDESDSRVSDMRALIYEFVKEQEQFKNATDA